mmetsp:Transcript_7876/g.33519  ORF Transcript_7876/g.33519 Transcript_7876/m.33519 type:complete len:511 (-) Transcript_7876:1024-2556(-)
MMDATLDSLSCARFTPTAANVSGFTRLSACADLSAARSMRRISSAPVSAAFLPPVLSSARPSAVAVRNALMRLKSSGWRMRSCSILRSFSESESSSSSKAPASDSRFTRAASLARRRNSDRDNTPFLRTFGFGAPVCSAAAVSSFASARFSSMLNAGANLFRFFPVTGSTTRPSESDSRPAASSESEDILRSSESDAPSSSSSSDTPSSSSSDTPSSSSSSSSSSSLASSSPSSSTSSSSSSPSSPSSSASRRAASAAKRSSRRRLAMSFCRSSAPATRSAATSDAPNAATDLSSSAPFPRSFFSSIPGASSLKSEMSARAAVATGLSLARLYCARSCNKSACITSGHRRQISRTVFIPTATTSGRARSCTNWFTSCLSNGSSASGGTSSWHAVAHAASSFVTSRWFGCTYRCKNGYRCMRCSLCKPTTRLRTWIKSIFVSNVSAVPACSRWNRRSAKACGSFTKVIAANRASLEMPSSFLLARRMEATWRFSFSCFFFFVRVTPLLYAR